MGGGWRVPELEATVSVAVSASHCWQETPGANQSEGEKVIFVQRFQFMVTWPHKEAERHGGALYSRVITPWGQEDEREEGPGPDTLRGRVPSDRTSFFLLSLPEGFSSFSRDHCWEPSQGVLGTQITTVAKGGHEQLSSHQTHHSSLCGWNKNSEAHNLKQRSSFRFRLPRAQSVVSWL